MLSGIQSLSSGRLVLGAGVSGLMVEVPDASTAERVEVLEKLGGPA